MELRHIPVSVSHNLAKFFEGDDNILSLLMGNIATDLENPNSPLRFTSSDIDSVRNHAQQMMKSPILILIDEWSTMGKTRPRLHHLLALLAKCQLFRAADYLAQLIGEPEPARPNHGPAARIDISLPDDIEDIVNEMGYPYSAEAVNRDVRDVKPAINPPIIKFETDSTTKENNISIPFIRPPQTSASSNSAFKSQQSTHRLTSDLIKFSKSNAQTERHTSNNGETSHLYIPAFSALQMSAKIPETISLEPEAAQNDFVLPALSGLMLNGNSHTSAEFPEILESFEIKNRSETIASGNIPNFSKIFSGETSSQTINHTQSSINSSDSDI